MHRAGGGRPEPQRRREPPEELDLGRAPRAVRLAEKSGFQASGRMRQSIIKYGGLHDSLVMDLLREEYFARHPELTDTLPAL